MTLDMDSIFPTPKETFEEEVISDVVKSRSNIYFLGADSTPTGVVNTIVETEVLDVNLAANVVVNGIIIEATHNMVIKDTINDEGYFRIKVGTDGSEVEKFKLTYEKSAEVSELEGDPDNTDWQGHFKTIKIVVDDLDWKKPQTISCTIQFDNAALQNFGSGYSLIVTGF